MKFYLSTIADVEYSWDEETQTESEKYIHNVGNIVKNNGLGLELAEFCITENCDHPEIVKDFFKENVNNYTKDLILHAPYNELFPHAIDKKVVDVAEERYEISYRLCEKLGIKKMIVHANYVQSLYFPSWFKQKQIEFWNKFLDKNAGECIICVENVMEYTPDLITDILDGVNSPRLKMCLDVGHANLHPQHSLEEWIDACAPYISHLHIHNNQGFTNSENGMSMDLHRGLANGILDYKYILNKIDQLGINNLTATIESYEYKESVNWLKNNGFI